LAGRVPVNVTTENGYVMKGDQITSSSLPGYGMVAIETGRVIGTALETLDANNFQDCPVETDLPVGTQCGQVMVFVNLMDFSGMTLADLMTKKNYDAAAQNPEFANLFASLAAQGNAGEIQGEDTLIKSEWTDIFQAANTLGFLKKLNDPAQGAALNSEILVKNVNASGSVVSPLIVTDTLIAKNIKAETIEGLEIFETDIQNAQDSADSSARQVKSLREQIADLQGAFKTLNEKSGGLEIASLEDSKSSGGLIINGSAQFNGLAVFHKVAQFFDRTIFGQEAEFSGGAVFNQDAAGYALIKEGQKTVVVTFEREYPVVPVVNASLSLQQIADEEVRKAAEELLLVADVKFIITNVTAKGFEIRVNQAALSDIPFSWQAMAVKDGKIFESESVASADNQNGENNGLEDISAAVEILAPGEEIPSEESAAADSAETISKDIVSSAEIKSALN